MEKMATSFANTMKQALRKHHVDDDNSVEEDEDISVSLLDGDKPVNKKQIKWIIANHSYALSSYAQRAVVQQAKALELVWAMQAQDPYRAQLVTLLSQAIRDTYISIYKPGGKPLQSESVALSHSLLPNRFSKAEITQMHAGGVPKPPKWRPGSEKDQHQQPKQPKPFDLPKPDPKK